MRLTLSHRSWAMLAACALSGCTTFDRPVASSRPHEPPRDQRLQEDVNRRIQAGDLDGAKKLLDQADRDKGTSPGRSHARSDDAGNSGIQQVGYESAVPSREEIIREFVKDLPPHRQAQEAQRFRDMPIATLRQLYLSQQQANALGHAQLNQREVARDTTTTQPSVEAPNPRGSNFGGTSPWPLNNGTVEQTNAVVGNNSHTVPTPEATASAAATLAVTSTGTRLTGIQTNDPKESTNELPLINPATPGSTILPVITPRRTGSVPETVAPIDKTADNLQNSIEQVTGTVPTAAGSGVPSPNAGIPGPTTNSKPQGPQTANIAGPSPNAPATLPGTVEPLQKPSTTGPDRRVPKLPNPLPSGMQKLNQTAKSALDRTLGLGFTPASQPDPTVAVVPSNLDTNPLLNSLISQLETQLAAAAPGATEAEKLEHVRRHVNLRMLHLMASQNDRAIEPIKGLDADEQEFWQHLIWSIANYFDAQGMPRASDRASQTVAELRTATQKLKSQADLELRSVTFCQRIDSYGNFERLSRDQFPPGSAVLLYAEVENFSSSPAEGDRQMTALKSTIEFYKAGVASEKPIQSIPFKVTQDYCRTKRRDFYLAFEFAIPQQLEAGVYTLVLKTEDQVGKKVATARVNFTVE